MRHLGGEAGKDDVNLEAIFSRLRDRPRKLPIAGMWLYGIRLLGPHSDNAKFIRDLAVKTAPLSLRPQRHFMA